MAVGFSSRLYLVNLDLETLSLGGLEKSLCEEKYSMVSCLGGGMSEVPESEEKSVMFSLDIRAYLKTTFKMRRFEAIW